MAHVGAPVVDAEAVVWTVSVRLANTPAGGDASYIREKNKKVEMNFENLNVKYLQDSCLHLLLLLCHPLLLCPLLRSLLPQHHILHLCFILYTRVFVVSTHPRLLRTDYSWPIASS